MNPESKPGGTVSRNWEDVYWERAEHALNFAMRVYKGRPYADVYRLAFLDRMFTTRLLWLRRAMQA